MLGSAGRRLLSNSGWNLLGLGAGLLAALVAIPILIRNLGTAAFGVFSIYMAVVGYFGLLDLGIGRAVTTKVAHHDSRHEPELLASSVATAVAMLAVLGAAGCIAILVFRNAILNTLLANSPGTVTDGANSLAVLAITIPAVLLSGVFRGALEGLREFKRVSQIAMPVSALLFAAPALASFWSPTLTSMMWAVLAVRVLALVLFARLSFRRVAGLHLTRPVPAQAGLLLRTGGWMTVSNVVSPLMTNLDRVLIGTQVSMTAVAHYVTPYEMATRVLVGASSISSAAYPEFVRLAADETPVAARRRHFLRTSALTFLAAFIPAAIVFAFAHQILSAWISAEFADASYEILRVLLIGVAINGASYIPFALVQGSGRPDITAKFHLVELCLYLPALFGLLSVFGVIGAAFAWVGRVTLDAAMLFGYALRSLR